MTVALVAVMMSATGVLAAQDSAQDVLTRARIAYNERRFDDAITLAGQARKVDRLSNSAALVFARASLERFRQQRDVADVATARQALLSVTPARLSPVEARELRLGTAELLFVDDQFGAAAEIFESELGAATESAEERDRLFDWWASSLDQHAHHGLETDRFRSYARLLAGAEKEVGRTPVSPSAMYWLAAACRGIDDFDRAWAVAVAGWVQALTTAPGERGDTLQHDLDRLVRDAIIPGLASRAAPPSDPVALRVALAAEWDSIKKRWGR